MKIIDSQYINGDWVNSHGREQFELVNPSNQQLIGRVTLGNELDAQDAIKAARLAFKDFGNTSIKERQNYLQRLHDAVAERVDDLIAAMIDEYGAPHIVATFSSRLAATSFLNYKNILDDFKFERIAGRTRVVLEPLGTAGIITPWNANASFICNKLATAIAAGCTTVIKPSELSAIQTSILLECLHEAGLPPGVFNVINGLGAVVGAEITRHPDIAKISFTGSTVVGKTIARDATNTLKRVTLELGGKSANILLDDADLDKAIPLALQACFGNNGQACIAGSRLLVQKDRLEEVKARLKKAIAYVTVGDPRDANNSLGPLVNLKQYERVQSYIRSGIAEGAELLAGGIGHPEGLDGGNFVRPTIFAGVTPDMTIAREEIFGPVLSVLTYETEAEAIEMANDTVYGLQAYVSSADPARAASVARQLIAGRVVINEASHDPLAPFGGFKQSGIGREYGVFGLEEYLEPKAILVG